MICPLFGVVESASAPPPPERDDLVAFVAAKQIGNAEERAQQHRAIVVRQIDQPNTRPAFGN